MLTVSEIKKRLKDRRLQVVADETGLHYNTLKNIRDGKNKNPTNFVVTALSNYLEKNA